MCDHKIGPTLPPNWKQNDDSVDHKSEEEEDQVYGPTLPPNLKPQTQEPNSSTSGVIGPTLPQHLKPTKRIVDESDSDSDDMIGPIPQTHHKFDKINEKFKYNEQLLAEREARKEIRQEREEWMTQMGKPLASKIPTKSVKHFSQRPAKSNDKNLEKNYKRNDRRDQQLTQIMDSFNKSQKRDVSLIDLHTSSSSKKSKKDEKKEEERVPFDPEKDLSVRRLDSRQTKSVLNKAKTFNDRFSLGINKFL